MANVTCDLECCQQCGTGASLFTDAAEPITLRVLTVGWKANAIDDLDVIPDFEAAKNGGVKIDTSASTDVSGFDELFTEIEDDSRLGLDLIDVYLTPPTALGSAALYDGFADFRDYITENYLSEWLDILPGYRDLIATYESKIMLMPIDGDMLHLFYNREVLAYYDRQPPRTWGEYNDIAEFVSGKVFPLTNKTLVGSCIGRTLQCAGPYWATQVLSSMTQTRGLFEGSLFDTKDMKLLTGDAFLEMLRLMERQSKFGHEEEFDKCIAVNMNSMDEEHCVLSYNWGNSFTNDIARGKLGIAKIPGAQKVLDRETGKLVQCDKERCPHASYYDDLGFVNHVPYAAFGGWAGAVSANASPEKQHLAMEFLAFMASKTQSQKQVIPQIGSPEAGVGHDPFRKSHLDLESFVKQGYDRDTAKTYLNSITMGLQSPNLAIDIRFPQATKLMSALDKHVVKHLTETKEEFDEGILVSKRQEALVALNSEWQSIIADYDSRGDTEIPLLEQYQRLRGVYARENENRNLMGSGVRIAGWTLGGMVMLVAIALAGWVSFNRSHRVVKMSQPLFLLIVCLGVFVLSSAIFPLGIDDSIATIKGCDMACASIPFLISMGFTFVFAALFSKLWRINQVFRAASRFQRVVIRERDVLRPFLLLMTLNIVLLLSWTLVDPLRWHRVYTDELNSYGRCSAEGGAWKGFLSALALLNFCALILANVQAYRARSINDELSESKYIGLTTLSMFQIFVVGVPLLAIVYENPPAYFFVCTAIIFIVSSSILCLIFIPKVVSKMKPQSQRPSQSSRHSSVASTGYSVGEGFSIPGLNSRDCITPQQLAVMKKEIKDQILREHNVDASSIIDAATKLQSQVETPAFRKNSSVVSEVAKNSYDEFLRVLNSPSGA